MYMNRSLENGEDGRIKNGRKKVAKCIMAHYNNTQNRDDHCAHHTSILSYF